MTVDEFKAKYGQKIGIEAPAAAPAQTAARSTGQQAVHAVKAQRDQVSAGTSPADDQTVKPPPAPPLTPGGGMGEARKFEGDKPLEPADLQSLRPVKTGPPPDSAFEPVGDFGPDPALAPSSPESMGVMRYNRDALMRALRDFQEGVTRPVSEQEKEEIGG